MFAGVSALAAVLNVARQVDAGVPALLQFAATVGLALRRAARRPVTGETARAAVRGG